MLTYSTSVKDYSYQYESKNPFCYNTKRVELFWPYVRPIYLKYKKQHNK